MALIRSKLKLFISRGLSSQAMPPLSELTRLSNGTPEDYRRAQVYFAKAASPEAITERLFGLLRNLRGVNLGYQIDLYEHSIQTATRALQSAGSDEETVVCALLHDVGELLAPACHGEVAGSLLRPYISPKNYWILTHHEIFQVFYYGEACNIDKNIRDRFRDHPFFEACERFCELWDEKSFDPNFASYPLEEFRPMVQRILARSPYSIAGQLDMCEMSAAKAALGVYDFQDWTGKNIN